MKKRLFSTLLVAVFLLLALPSHSARAQGFEPNFDEGMAAFNYGDNELALRHFMRLANDGEPRAQYYLAYMMDSGLGMGKDVYGASGWYAKSAAQNYLPAMVYMGYIASAGHGMQADPKKAFDWYTKAAQMGDAVAQNNLATMLRAGNPYQADKPLAAQWFLQSAMQGNMRAQYNLATMYRTGDGIKKNIAEALKWYNYAANQGDMYAQYALGYLYLSNSKDAAAKADEAKDAAKAEKDPDKQKTLQQQIASDASEADSDRDQALEWFRRAAEQGDTAAQMAVAHMYESGDAGPDKGIEDAVIWYLHAAEAGKAEAMRRLGLLYEVGKDSKGNGLTQDVRQAYKWYRKAADEKDDKPSMIALGQMYENGEGSGAESIRRDPKKAFGWYMHAAETGDPLGMINVARMYHDGTGTDKSLSASYKWYALAVKQYQNTADADGLTDAIRDRTKARVELGSPGEIAGADAEVASWHPVVHTVAGIAKKDDKLFYDEK